MGLSLLEISHRSKPFVTVMEEAQSLVRELLGIGDDYSVLQVGASMYSFVRSHRIYLSHRLKQYI